MAKKQKQTQTRIERIKQAARRAAPYAAAVATSLAVAATGYYFGHRGGQGSYTRGCFFGVHFVTDNVGIPVDDAKLTEFCTKAAKQAKE